MTLTVEDGTGITDAESYVSVAETDTYFTNLSNANWTGTDAVKEAALRKATEFLDATYTWKGTIYSKEQSLGWPRTGVYDQEGRDLKESVPLSLKRATFELALASLSADLVTIQNNSNYVKREKVGELEVEYRNNAPVDRQYKYVDRLLDGLYSKKLGSSNVGVIRA